MARIDTAAADESDTEDGRKAAERRTIAEDDESPVRCHSGRCRLAGGDGGQRGGGNRGDDIAEAAMLDSCNERRLAERKQSDRHKSGQSGTEQQ